MAKRKTPSDEDEEQSKRFLEIARELEAAGELNLTDDGLERTFGKLVPPRKRAGPKED